LVALLCVVLLYYAAKAPILQEEIIKTPGQCRLGIDPAKTATGFGDD